MKKCTAIACQIFIFTLVLVFASVSFSKAEDKQAVDHTGTTRIGAGNKVLKTSFSMANLMGLTYLHYESEYFALGGAAYTGQISNGATGSYSEGGIVAVYQWPTGKGINFNGNILFGSGGGSSIPSTGSGMVIDPAFGIDLPLGKRIRGVINLGYDWNPAYPTYSSVTGEFRIDFLNID